MPEETDRVYQIAYISNVYHISNTLYQIFNIAILHASVAKDHGYKIFTQEGVGQEDFCLKTGLACLTYFPFILKDASEGGDDDVGMYNLNSNL